MNRMQHQVAEFHRLFKIPIVDKPQMYTPERAQLRMSLIAEESNEFYFALESEDIVEATDALVDLLYVTFGAALELGVDLEEVFDEVHRSNMLKAGGTIREDGKVLKPEGWVKPDIKSILERQGWQS